MYERLPSLLLACACATLFSACTSPAKSEASSLAQAVERYRQADNNLKSSTADALDKTPCSADDVCDTKRACTEAADPTARGLALKNEVEQGLAEVRAHKLDPDDPRARSLPDKLEEASRLLEKGHAALPSCTEKIMGLKRRYGI